MINKIPKEHYKSAGIYCIKNLVNGKVYIGSTSKLKQRYNQHNLAASKYTHGNKAIYNAYKKYGSASFQMNVLEIVDIDAFIFTVQRREFIEKREQYWIDKFKSNKKEFGYNIRKKASSNLGIEYSDEYKNSLKGRKLSLETCKKMSERIRKNGHPQAKLTKDQVCIIRTLVKKGYKRADVARHFNMSRTTVNDIVKNKIWQYVPFDDKIFKKYSHIEINNNLVTTEQIKQIKYLLDRNVSTRFIYYLIRVKYHTIKDIGYNTCYKDINYTNDESMVYSSMFDNRVKMFEQKLIIAGNKSSLTKRRNKNTSNPNSKLSNSQVLEIASKIKSNVNRHEIAKQYNVSYHCIKKIETGDNHSRITGFKKTRTGMLKGESSPVSKYTENQVLYVVKNYNGKISKKDFAKKIGLGYDFVNRVLRGDSWSHVTGIKPKT